MQRKILIFSIAYLPFIGGAEMAIKEITGRMRDFQFDMITLRFDSQLPEFEKMGNVNVYRIGFTKKNPTMADLVKWPLKINKFLFPFSACWKAYRLNSKNRYYAIWSVMAAFAGFAAVFFKTTHAKIPYLLTLQEGDSIEQILKKVKFVRPIFKMIFTKADFIQVISQHLASWALAMGYHGRLEVVPNGVAIKLFSQSFSSSQLDKLKNTVGKKQHDRLIITTSRLVKKNAIDHIIRALKMLPDNFKFLILGSGPDEEKLKELSRKLGVNNRVIFYGSVGHDKMPKFLKISDVFIRPSLSEGLGSSFLEAMAAGIPVVGTPVGGILDFLKDGETGLFCQVNNPKSIAEKIELILRDGALQQKIITNSKELVIKNYDWEIVSRKMEKIFEELIYN